MNAGADPSQDDQHAKVASLGHNKDRREMDYDNRYNIITQEKGR